MTRSRRSSLPLLVLVLAACSGREDAPVPFEADGVKPPAAGGDGALLEPAPRDEDSSAVTATATGPQAGATVNSVDTVLDDMRRMNDAVLAGVPTGPGWTTGPGYVVMGNDPRGTRTPSWWNPANKTYKSGSYWTVVLPWVVIFDGVGNAASNTRVEMRNLQVWGKSRATTDWNRIQDPISAIGGELYPKHLQGDATQSPDRREAGGATSVRPPGGDLVFHGWGSKRPVDGADLECIFITMQARLVVGDPAKPDDRAQAKYLVHVGGDYYPDAQTSLSAFAPAYYLPGVGVSRAKLVTNEWQAFNFASVSGGVEDPGGATISAEAFRAAPPPLE